MPFFSKCLAVVALWSVLSGVAITVAGAEPATVRAPSVTVQQEARDIRIGMNWKLAWPIVHRWQLAVEAQQRAAAAERAREAARARQQQQQQQQQSHVNAQAQPGNGACGGDLPPCFVLRRESHGDLRIWNGGCYNPIGFTGQNPCGSNASGKWQFMRRTWNYFMGYVNAADAPESVQDAKARQVWAVDPGAWACC